MIRPILALVVVSLLAASALLTPGVFAGEHGIQMQAVTPWNDPNGYTPVVVTVEATREIDLELHIDSDAGGATAMVRVTEGRPSRQTILLPPSNRDWVRYNQVVWNGPGGINGSTQINGAGHQQIRCALIDPKQQIIDKDLETKLEKVVAKSSGSSSRLDLVLHIQPEDLPDRWQGYPDWLVLALTPTGDAGLDDAQRQAIAAWTLSGGVLVVTTADLAREWQARQAEVRVDPLTGDAAILGAAINQNVTAENWQPVDAPVPGTETVPVKTFVFLALAFAIVVGPLNLWWVRRRNARHLFLITTPLLSFVTCVVLIVASLVADGISVKRDAVQACYIDHRTQQMIRWTGCTYFAAFARSQIDLDAQTKLRVLDREDYSYSYRRSSGDGERLHLDWRSGQYLSGSVLPARLNRQLSYTEHMPERRRLVVSRSGNDYQVTNGLGTAVHAFAWRDEKGSLWTCDQVAAGEVVALTSVVSDKDFALSMATNPSTTWEVDALPAKLANRIGRDVGLAYETLQDRPLTFVAVLVAPMDALPGPTADDPEPPDVIAFGYLPLGGTTVEGKP